MTNINFLWLPDNYLPNCSWNCSQKFSLNFPQNRPWNWFFSQRYKIDIILAMYYNQLLNNNISQVQTSELKNLLTFIKGKIGFIWDILDLSAVQIASLSQTNCATCAGLITFKPVTTAESNIWLSCEKDWTRDTSCYVVCYLCPSKLDNDIDYID